MINIYDDNNKLIPPLAAEMKPCGESYNYHMNKWGCNYALPFSSLHKYIREDSIHMNKFITPLNKHFDKFNNKNGEMLPAFIRWDCEKQIYKKIDPEENNLEIKKPEYFGDNWSDDLTKDDELIIENYFKSLDYLKKKFGFLSFKIGSKELNIKLSDRKEGIKFRCPRSSFMHSIKNNIFDDLLIGNFMKVELINVPSLYPDFTPYVSKYADNGGAKSLEELNKYFEYYKLNSANYWFDKLNIKTEQLIRTKLKKNKTLYFMARKIRRLF